VVSPFGPEACTLILIKQNRQIREKQIMRKTLFTATSLCALLMVFSALALAQGSFAGTWELDKSKSKMNERMAAALKSQTLTVTQDDKEIKADRKTEMDAPAGGGPGGGGGRGGGMMGGAPNSTYKLDGSEVVTENPRGKMSSKAKLAGGKLEVKTVNNVNFNGNEMTINGSETWELADGGKTLKITQVRETPNGAMETTMVYSKK
jgi:hypothetical protein